MPVNGIAFVIEADAFSFAEPRFSPDFPQRAGGLDRDDFQCVRGLQKKGGEESLEAHLCQV